MIKSKRSQLMGGSDDVMEDTIYYRITDDLGNQSIIHDSGIRHTTLNKCDNIHFAILKNEYNDGTSKNISKPIKIEIGYNPKHLYSVDILSVKEEDLLYRIEIRYLCI